MKILTAILIIDLCLLYWAQGEAPPPPVSISSQSIRTLSASNATAIVFADGSTGSIGQPIGRKFNEVSSVLELIEAAQIGHAEPLAYIPPASKIAGGFNKREPFKPYFATYVKTDLFGDWTEHRFYLPGDTAYFKTELVTE